VNPETEYPVPAAAMFDTVNVALPPFVIVIVCVVDALTFTFPKATLVGETDIAGCGAVVPVPVNATTTLGVAELFATVTLPVLPPVTVGANLATNVELCPAGIEIGNVKPETEYPDPAAVMFETVNAAFPPFVIVIVCGVETPTFTFPKATLAGLTDIVGCAAVVPVALNATTTLGVAELFAIVTLPERLPVVGGTTFALNVVL
jgi:phosphoribosylcarboxyaminoimidazole (NCAIR) mutase